MSRKPTTIILIHGLMRSGKDTLADMLRARLISCSDAETITNIRFADALKKDCETHIQPILEVVNTKIEKLYQMIRQMCLDGKELESIITKPENWYENKTELTRLFLQKIGTEFCRATDNDVWVKRFVDSVCKLGDLSVLKYITCSDLRFENEAYIEEFFTKEERKYIDIVRVKIIRGSAEVNGVIGHASESGLPDNMFDFIVENNYDLKVLEECANTIIDSIFGQLDDNVVHIINDEGDLQPMMLPLNYTRKLNPAK